MVLFEMSRKQKGKRQAGPVSGCPKFVLGGDTIPDSKSNPIQDETIEERCWEGGALVEVEAGRSRSLELVTGDQFAPGSHPVKRIAHQDHRPQLQLCLSQGVTSNY